MNQQTAILVTIFFIVTVFTYAYIYYDQKKDSAKKSAKK